MTRQGLVAWVERVTSAFAVITTDHALIHEGRAFGLTGTMTILAGDVGGILFKTPVEGWIHFKAANVSSNAAVSASLMRGYTKGTSDVSVLTPPNYNDASSRVSTITATGGTDLTLVTVTGYGTLATASIGANLPSYKVGGSVQQAEERVLKQDTDYVLAISNATAGPAIVNYDLFWYEEDGA